MKRKKLKPKVGMAANRNLKDLSLAELENVLRLRRARITSLEKKRERFLKQIQALDAEIAGMGGLSRSSSGRARNKQSLNEAIVDVLKKAGGALRVGDIADGVLATGYQTTSANFRGIVNQALIKDKQFGKGDTRGAYILKK